VTSLQCLLTLSFEVNSPGHVSHRSLWESLIRGSTATVDRGVGGHGASPLERVPVFASRRSAAGPQSASFITRLQRAGGRNRGVHRSNFQYFEDLTAVTCAVPQSKGGSLADDTSWSSQGTSMVPAAGVAK